MENQRKPAAKYAKSKFLEDRNDIVFFIEDTDKATKKIFKEILSNVFNDKKISDIFPLGGRIEVVNRCRQSKEQKKTEKAIYIIDGDLYLLSGENREIFGDLSDLNNLFVLSRYCIENYLIDEDPILQILDEEECVKDIRQIVNEFKFSEWREKNSTMFKELYIHYAIAKKVGSGIPTISYGINKLVSSSMGELDKVKVENRVEFLRDQIIKDIGSDCYEEARIIIEDRINKNHDFLLHYVSGKDHLFPLLITRMKQVSKLRCEHATYKVRLAKKVIPEEFKRIVDLVDSLYA